MAPTGGRITERVAEEMLLGQVLVCAVHAAWSATPYVLTYRRRRMGRRLQTVIEVIRWDPTTQDSVVVSAYGPTAGGT